jgi:hypothetical protein
MEEVSRIKAVHGDPLKAFLGFPAAAIDFGAERFGDPGFFPFWG